MTVREFVEQTSIIDPAVSVSSRLMENDLRERFSNLNIDIPTQSYRRYGYPLANYVAQRFWSDCCTYHGLDSSILNRFRARVFNSGMSAIVAAIETFDLSAGDTVIYHNDCYFATSSYMEMLRRRGIIVHAVDVRDFKNVQALSHSNMHGRTFIVTESVTNHVRMITAPLTELAKLIDISTTSAPVYLVVDNTLPGAPQIDPIVFCSDSNRIVYVESLTKYYHTDESGIRSIGIVIFPAILKERIDHITAVFGFYLQLPEVLALPYDLFHIGAVRIAQITDTVRLLTEYIASQQRLRQLPFVISIPTPYQQKPTVTPWPGVIFMRLEAHGECNATQCVMRLLSETGFLERGSFGHRATTILPIGLRWNNVDDGIVRIAIGSDDSIDMLRSTFQQFFKHY